MQVNYTSPTGAPIAVSAANPLPVTSSAASGANMAYGNLNPAVGIQLIAAARPGRLAFQFICYGLANRSVGDANLTTTNGYSITHDVVYTFPTSSAIYLWCDTGGTFFSWSEFY